MRARRDGATHLVDLATLTGALRAGMGDLFAGVFAPETVLPAERFFHGLSAAGLKVTEICLEQRRLNS